MWERLESLFPDDPRVQEQIAVTLVEEGEYKLALPRYEKLATMVKDDYRRVVFRIEAAELKIRDGQRDEGLSDFEGLLANLNPTGWLHRDVRRKDRIVLALPNGPDFFSAFYGTQAAGCIAVPVFPWAVPARSISAANHTDFGKNTTAPAR